MVGYRGTDKPKESKEYVQSLLAKDIVNILDHENVKDVIAVGHECMICSSFSIAAFQSLSQGVCRGSKTVGMLANLYGHRFIGFGFLAAGYLPPGSTAGNVDELRETVRNDRPCFTKSFLPPS